jgi:hypothetical protein
MNSKTYEKSRGVILFAFRSRIDYVAIADATARLIEKNLKLPVTIITDFDAEPTFHYDKIIRAEAKPGNKRMDRNQNVYEWKNYDRYMAYDLSPYDETILLDTDFLVVNDSLLKLFEQDFSYKLQYQMQTPAELNTDEMGPVSLPMVWATIVLFRKCKTTELFFALIGKIQRNYNYYRTLYGIRDTNFRNDFAFSIANIVMSGYTVDQTVSIPWPMTTIENNIESIELRGDFFVVRYADRADVIAKQNLHIMDKSFLQSEQFKHLVGQLCNV